jgi:hypothetical protein
MKTVALDFDGVLHSYSGWNGELPTGDPIEGALSACQELAKRFNLIVFTTRKPELVEEWLAKHGFDMFSGITNSKPEWLVLVDDRCIRFNGTWTGLVERIDHFNPYWKT